MILTDIHTHTKFSADGRSDIREMIETALEKGLTYYGIAEHFNYDYDRLQLTIDDQPVPPIDERAYFTCARRLQKEYKSKLHLLIGAEFGYDNAASTMQRYAETEQKYHPDFVVNSVHTCLGMDCYFPHYCNGKSKEYAYNAYLYRVLESLEAPYRYDIVAHVGYCSRNATYPDPKLRYEDFADVIDAILKRIIAKNKILEVNSSAKTAGSPFIPDTDILTRYFEMGGRLISFASDAHDIYRVADRRDVVVAALKDVGFTYLTVPDRGKYLHLPL